MSPINISDVLNVRRRLERYTHGQHLTPRHADTDRTHRNRRNHDSHDRERRRRSLDRGYRSDNDSSRHRDEKRETRRRAESSRRAHHKDFEDRRQSEYYERDYELGKYANSPFTPEGEAAPREGARVKQTSKLTEKVAYNTNDELHAFQQDSMGNLSRTQEMRIEPPVAVEPTPSPQNGYLRKPKGGHSSHDVGVECSDDFAVETRRRRNDRPLSTVTMPPSPHIFTSGFSESGSTPGESPLSASNIDQPNVDRPSNAPVPRIFVPRDSNGISLESPPARFGSFRVTTRGSTESYIQGTGPPQASRDSLPSPISSPRSSMIGAASYQYLPLAEAEFRLVRVLPEMMSTVKCEIFHKSFNDSVKYTAVSYAWGDSLEKKPLMLEETIIMVATSLYDALESVRQKHQDVLVWIDALSIDQENEFERAKQVSLMGQIYSQAETVAVCLGPEADDSPAAMKLLDKLASKTVSPQSIRSREDARGSAALAALFKRQYWKRLWVVQEVFLASKKMVYCGDAVFPWEVYQQAADAFWGGDSDLHVREGPSSFPDINKLLQLGDESLLEVMRACRRKLSENPRDKVFGILGLLPAATQRELRVDYSQPTKGVYTDVVDLLLSTTGQIDVIRESIHFPLHTSTTGLPSWCPDWSHIPDVSGLGPSFNFNASGSTKALYRFRNHRRTLEISAIKLDFIRATGIAVGTFCKAQDYLIAFLHWRALLLHEMNIRDGDLHHPLHKAFCRTLCLGQIPEDQQRQQQWHDICYHVFSFLIRERLPRLAIDEDLWSYADAPVPFKHGAQRKVLQADFGNRMMGRRFCITKQGMICMGSGYMTHGDIVVVPLGCSTPILLRPVGQRNEYVYVGDIYVDGYMHGEAVREMETGKPSRSVSKYILS
ncbi:hypothetical protein HBH68_056640 [Parastagonospora nodorum]|nr:hypothetical protein HBH68_056640 [Parastagonospora nodorum]